MITKRLTSGKKIETEVIADLAFSVKEQLYKNVMDQFVETIKLPAEFLGISEEINCSGYLVLKTIHNFNEYCEVISGKRTEEQCNTEICALLSEISKLSEVYFNKKNLLLLTKIPEEEIFVNIERERFCYAFANLLLNAAENTPKSGRVRISVAKTQKFVKIVVGDNGFGMDEETLKNCFSPFYTKNNVPGKKKLGLGLTLAHRFAAENGGRMTVKSEIGKGTSVSMLLPIVQKDEKGLLMGSSVPDILGGKFSPIYIMLSGLEKD